jgi:hypothetical protein
MELGSVVAGIAKANGLTTLIFADEALEEDDSQYLYGSTVTASARKQADFGALAGDKQWENKETDSKQWVWTDDYSNIVGAMIRYMSD